MTTPNYSDAERELRRVEEIESAKMQDRTRAIVEAAERLEQHLHEVAESRTVGRNAKLADVVYAVEHGGALDGALARENVRQLLLALALPEAPPVPESKLRAVYDAAERLVARNAEGGSLVEAWEALEAALALPAEPAPAPSAIRSTVERLETLRQLVDLTHQNAVRSLQETSRCVQESLAEIRAELGTPASAPAWTKTPPSEPGWWFWREWCGGGDVGGGHHAEAGWIVECEFFSSKRLDPSNEYVGRWAADGREWWPVRLQEPPA